MAKRFSDLFGNMDDVFAGTKMPDLDEVLSKTKSFTEEVSKKSAEKIEVSRKKVECLDVKAKLSKAYEKFGRLQYTAFIGEVPDENAVQDAAADIQQLREKLERLNIELDLAKKQSNDYTSAE